MEIPIDVPHREFYWHILSPYKYFIYPLALIAIIFFAFGLYQRYKFWKAGQPDASRFNNWWDRIRIFLWEVLFQARVLRDPLGGVLHVLIFWSFLALLFTTTIVFLEVDFMIPIYRGPFYLFVTMFAEIAGVAFLLGLIIAAWRRYVSKSIRLDNKWDDAAVLILLFALIITGFWLEGLRIAHTADPWAMWSPVGYAVSFLTVNMQEPSVAITYQVLWWFHFALLFTFIAIIPFTKFLHIITLPLNILFVSLEPKGALKRPDIEALMESMDDDEEEFNIGVSSVEHLTWKQRLDLDACIHCGRCQEVCPAFANNKPLNPKELILDLKKFADSEYAAVPPNGNGEAAASDEDEKNVVGNAFTAEPLWECRTCRACMEECPAHIEHVPLIIDLRRAEVLMRGELPTEASQALVMLERGGNPFGSQQTRADWVREAKIPVVPEGGECEALLFIGCTSAYDTEKQKIILNLLEILRRAGVNVGTLGEDELCCGDPARLCGEENLFQTAAKTQIENIKSRKFDYLLTICPHGYNVFKNEYPQFTEPFKVLHHTELICQLIKDGRLKLPASLSSKITYHDSCYLGRYNDIYNEPREIIRSISGVQLVEMKKNRSKSLCCGAGGGHYWMDIETGDRINVSRLNQALETGADTLAVSCIYCHHMLNDAVKILDLEDKIKVKEISELIIDALGPENTG